MHNFVLDEDYCPSPFIWIAHSGCVYRNPSKKHFNSAKSLCEVMHADSNLYYPEESDTQYIATLGSE